LLHHIDYRKRRKEKEGSQSPNLEEEKRLVSRGRACPPRTGGGPLLNFLWEGKRKGRGPFELTLQRRKLSHSRREFRYGVGIVGGKGTAYQEGRGGEKKRGGNIT